MSYPPLWGEIKDGEGARNHNTTDPVYKPNWNESWRSTACKSPPLYNPVISQTTPTREQLIAKSLDYPKNCQNGNAILHMIELKGYIDEMKELTSSVTASSDDPLINPSRGGIIAPTPPANYWPDSTKKWCDISNSQKPDTEFKLPESLELNHEIIHLLSKRSVAAMCMYTGYDAAAGNCIDYLANVLRDYLKRSCSLLRINMDNYHNGKNFESILERTLVQLGSRGKRGLKQYWDKIVSEHMTLVEDAQDQMEQFKLVMGDPIDKDKLIESLSLPLSTRKDSNINDDIISPPFNGTNFIMGGIEEELSNEINLDNVISAKTPDLSSTTGYHSLTEREMQQDDMLDFDSLPLRKRARIQSFNTE